MRKQTENCIEKISGRNAESFGKIDVRDCFVGNSAFFGRIDRNDAERDFS